MDGEIITTRRTVEEIQRDIDDLTRRRSLLLWKMYSEQVARLYAEKRAAMMFDGK